MANIKDDTGDGGKGNDFERASSNLFRKDYVVKRGTTEELENA